MEWFSSFWDGFPLCDVLISQHLFAQLHHSPPFIPIRFQCLRPFPVGIFHCEQGRKSLGMESMSKLVRPISSRVGEDDFFV